MYYDYSQYFRTLIANQETLITNQQSILTNQNLLISGCRSILFVVVCSLTIAFVRKIFSVGR